jgi:hypothetical protein
MTPKQFLVFERLEFACDDAAVIGHEANGSFGVGPNHGGERESDFDHDGEFFAEFANEGGLGAFGGFDFAAGELPESAEVFVGGAQAG